LKTTNPLRNSTKPFRVQKVSKYLAFEFYQQLDLDKSLISQDDFSSADERPFLDLKPFN
jgi:hypothetical protein